MEPVDGGTEEGGRRWWGGTRALRARTPPRTHTGGIHRRERDGRGAARHGGAAAGERLRVARDHVVVAGGADTRRPGRAAVPRGIREVPETADRADMDPGVVHRVQPVLGQFPPRPAEQHMRAAACQRQRLARGPLVAAGRCEEHERAAAAAGSRPRQRESPRRPQRLEPPAVCLQRVDVRAAHGTRAECCYQGKRSICFILFFMLFLFYLDTLHPVHHVHVMGYRLPPHPPSAVIPFGSIYVSESGAEGHL